MSASTKKRKADDVKRQRSVKKSKVEKAYRDNVRSLFEDLVSLLWSDGEEDVEASAHTHKVILERAVQHIRASEEEKLRAQSCEIDLKRQIEKLSALVQVAERSGVFKGEAVSESDMRRILHFDVSMRSRGLQANLPLNSCKKCEENDKNSSARVSSVPNPTGATLATDAVIVKASISDGRPCLVIVPDGLNAPLVQDKNGAVKKLVGSVKKTSAHPSASHRPRSIQATPTSTFIPVAAVAPSVRNPVLMPKGPNGTLPIPRVVPQQTLLPVTQYANFVLPQIISLIPTQITASVQPVPTSEASVQNAVTTSTLSPADAPLPAPATATDQSTPSASVPNSSTVQCNGQTVLPIDAAVEPSRSSVAPSQGESKRGERRCETEAMPSTSDLLLKNGKSSDCEASRSATSGKSLLPAKLFSQATGDASTEVVPVVESSGSKVVKEKMVLRDEPESSLTRSLGGSKSVPVVEQKVTEEQGSENPTKSSTQVATKPILSHSTESIISSSKPASPEITVVNARKSSAAASFAPGGDPTKFVSSKNIARSAIPELPPRKDASERKRSSPAVSNPIYSPISCAQKPIGKDQFNKTVVQSISASSSYPNYNMNSATVHTCISEPSKSSSCKVDVVKTAAMPPQVVGVHSSSTATERKFSRTPPLVPEPISSLPSSSSAGDFLRRSPEKPSRRRVETDHSIPSKIQAANPAPWEPNYIHPRGNKVPEFSTPTLKQKSAVATESPSTTSSWLQSLSWINPTISPVPEVLPDLTWNIGLKDSTPQVPVTSLFPSPSILPPPPMVPSKSSTALGTTSSLSVIETPLSCANVASWRSSADRPGVGRIEHEVDGSKKAVLTEKQVSPPTSSTRSEVKGSCNTGAFLSVSQLVEKAAPVSSQAAMHIGSRVMPPAPSTYAVTSITTTPVSAPGKVAEVQRCSYSTESLLRNQSQNSYPNGSQYGGSRRTNAGGIQPQASFLEKNRRMVQVSSGSDAGTLSKSKPIVTSNVETSQSNPHYVNSRVIPSVSISASVSHSQMPTASAASVSTPLSTASATTSTAHHQPLRNMAACSNDVRGESSSGSNQHWVLWQNSSSSYTPLSSSSLTTPSALLGNNYCEPASVSTTASSSSSFESPSLLASSAAAVPMPSTFPNFSDAWNRRLDPIARTGAATGSNTHGSLSSTGSYASASVVASSAASFPPSSLSSSSTNVGLAGSAVGNSASYPMAVGDPFALGHSWSSTTSNGVSRSAALDQTGSVGYQSQMPISSDYGPSSLDYPSHLRSSSVRHHTTTPIYSNPEPSKYSLPQGGNPPMGVGCSTSSSSSRPAATAKPSFLSNPTSFVPTSSSSGVRSGKRSSVGNGDLMADHPHPAPPPPRSSGFSDVTPTLPGPLSLPSLFDAPGSSSLSSQFTLPSFAAAEYGAPGPIAAPPAPPPPSNFYAYGGGGASDNGKKSSGPVYAQLTPVVGDGRSAQQYQALQPRQQQPQSQSQQVEQTQQRSQSLQQSQPQSQQHHRREGSSQRSNVQVSRSGGGQGSSSAQSNPSLNFSLNALFPEINDNPKDSSQRKSQTNGATSVASSYQGTSQAAQAQVSQHSAAPFFDYHRGPHISSFGHGPGSSAVLPAAGQVHHHHHHSFASSQPTAQQLHVPFAPLIPPNAPTAEQAPFNPLGFPSGAGLGQIIHNLNF